MEIVQRLRYEVDNKEVDQTAEKLDALIGAIGDLQKANQGGFESIAKGMGKVTEETEAAGAELDKNKKKLTLWQRAANRAGTQARKFGDQITIAGVSLTDISDRLTGASKSVTSFASGASKGGKTAAKGFFTARTAAIAFQLSIGIILGVVALMVAALSRSQKVMDGVADAVAVATAVFDVFADRAALFGQVLFEIFTGDVIGAVDSYKEATKGLTEELGREAARALEVAEATRAIRRESILLTAERAKARAEIKALGLVSEDVTKAEGERLKAAQEAFKVQSKITAEQTRLARESINNQLKEGFSFGDLDSILSAAGSRIEKFEAVRNIAGESLTTDAGVQELIDGYSEVFSILEEGDEARTTLNNRTNTIQEQARQKYLKYAEDRRKAEQEFADTQLQIRDALRASDELTAEEQINRNRTIALEQIAELERVTKEKAAAAKVQFDGEAEFAELRLRANAAAEKEIAELKVAQQKEAIDAALKEELAYIDLLSVSGDERLSLEEFQARERVAIQVKALQDIQKATIAAGGEGVDAAVLEIDVQIAELNAQDVAVLTANNARIRDERLKALTDQENIENARVDILKESSSEDLNLAQAQELAKLQIAKRGIEERLKIQEEAGASEAELILLGLQGDKIQQQIDELENIRLGPIERLVGKIKDAFKLDDETLAEITGQLGGAIENIAAGVESLREAELSRIDGQIEAAQERQEELRNLLEQEQADQAAGYANNVGLYEAALSEQERIEQENVNKRLEIQKRAANQQLEIESVQQTASLTTAAAKLIASEASKGLVGLVIGIGALGLLFSTMARAKANAAAFSAPTFREGTKSAEGVLIGPSHEGGGIPGFYNQNGGRYAVEMEGGERVFSRKHNRMFAPLFDAIQDKNVNGMDGILAAVGGDIFNGALGTPTIKIDAPKQQKNQAAKDKGVHFLKLNDKQVLRIDESGPVRRMEKISMN